MVIDSDVNCDAAFHVRECINWCEASSALTSKAFLVINNWRQSLHDHYLPRTHDRAELLAPEEKRSTLCRAPASLVALSSQSFANEILWTPALVTLEGVFMCPIMSSCPSVHQLMLIPAAPQS
ncbi:hypothetical protein AAHC03_0650 [Spirometra sp. Aus1]